MSKHLPIALLASALMAMPVGSLPYGPEDWDDPDRPHTPPKRDYRIEPKPLSTEAMEENKRLSSEKKRIKETEDAILKMLKEDYPNLSGKALRKKLKDLRRGLK